MKDTLFPLSSNGNVYPHALAAPSLLYVSPGAPLPHVFPLVSSQCLVLVIKFKFSNFISIRCVQSRHYWNQASDWIFFSAESLSFLPRKVFEAFLIRSFRPSRAQTALLTGA